MLPVNCLWSIRVCEHYAYLSRFERAHAICLTQEESEIGGSLVICAKMMSHFNYVGWNGYIMDEHTVKNSVDLKRQEAGYREMNPSWPGYDNRAGTGPQGKHSDPELGH